jgi:hypothetical protein
MHRFLKYTIFFVVVVALQVFLFDNLNLSVYINPLVYVVFILLLPMETQPVAVLLLGTLMGWSVDFLTGTPGLNTIALAASAFVRRPLLTLILGREDVKDGGIPGTHRFGRVKFFNYILILTLLHNVIYFSFEALSWSYFYMTLVKIVCSTAITIPLIYLVGMLLTDHAGGKAAEKRK